MLHLSTSTPTPSSNNGCRLPIALFHRDFRSYTGGHGKVWDYFNHIRQSGLYQARIFFTHQSVFDQTNPWKDCQDVIVKTWKPGEADLFFLAGMDWQALPEAFSQDKPIINLIQGVRHADPNLPLYHFLSRHAIRICVSEPVADAILATGQVNGPVFVIPNGIETLAPLLERERCGTLFIDAVKNRQTGIKLAQELQTLGYTVQLLAEKLPRADYLTLLARARLAILLPTPVEGFYLPGLEAMALGVPVVMTDCIGNRQYANHNENCLIVPSSKIVNTIRGVGKDTLHRLQIAGLKTAKQYTLEQERDRFFSILFQLANYSKSRKAKF